MNGIGGRSEAVRIRPVAPNGYSAHEGEGEVEQRQAAFQILVSAEAAEPEPGPRRKLVSAGALLIILLFWIAQVSLMTALRLIRFPEEGIAYLPPRLLVTCFGIAASVGILAIQSWLRRYPLWKRAIAAVALALIGTLAHTAVNRFVFGFVGPQTADPDRPLVLDMVLFLEPVWVYACLSAIVLVLTYGEDIREREERIRTLHALAHTAQLRALRNQLNPHFLFNALNSITALMGRRRNDEAEAMTENLADFLRTTLALDPQQEITLSEEIRLQQLYLDIEKVRFPDRLKVSVRVPEGLGSALLPGLITQPIIENSVKHAVARSSEPVAIEIAASAQGGRLELVIRDDGGNADAAAGHVPNIGLSNVRERLRTHYGEQAALEVGGEGGTGFVNRISLPLRWES